MVITSGILSIGFQLVWAADNRQIAIEDSKTEPWSLTLTLITINSNATVLKFPFFYANIYAYRGWSPHLFFPFSPSSSCSAWASGMGRMSHMQRQQPPWRPHTRHFTVSWQVDYRTLRYGNTRHVPTQFLPWSTLDKWDWTRNHDLVCCVDVLEDKF